MIRAVILLGGPSKKASYGAYEEASPLFPIAGLEIIAHTMFAMQKLKNLKDIVLLGYYDKVHFKQLQERMQKAHGKPVHYVSEKGENGTAGGLAMHSDDLFDEVDDLLIVHSDICSDVNYCDFYEFHKIKQSAVSMVTVQVGRAESTKYGCLIKDKETDRMVHHAEKPDEYISDLVNCGIYLFSRKLQQLLASARKQKDIDVQSQLLQQPCLKYIKQSTNLNKDYLSLENDILKLAEPFGVHLFQINTFWQPIKNSQDILKANQLYLQHYQQYPLIFLNTEYIQQENGVLVHKTAKVSGNAKLGPYVVIGAGCEIGDGVRVSNSIIQDGVNIKGYSYVVNSIVSYNCIIGYWCRIEGTTSVCFLGPCATVDNELNVRNVVCLQNRRILQNYENEFIM